jgi:hypothetical protein
MLAKFWQENLMDKDHVKNHGADGRIILKWVQIK